MPHQEEEYIDYSCSTAVERLSRDVESLLRSWHIHDGCDRHFSVSTNPKGLTLLRAERLTWVATVPSNNNPHQQQQVIKMDLELALWDGPASKAPASSRGRRQNMMASTSPSSPPTTISTSNSSSPDSNNNKKKRSSKKNKKGKTKKRTAKGMFARGSRRSSLSNDECIANFFPPLNSPSNSNNSINDLDASTHSVMTSIPDEEEEPYKQHLPKSLQRPQHPKDLTDMPDSLFDNFSTLFGIGQHITLTPINPLMDLGIPPYSNNSSKSQLASFTQFCSSLLVRHQPQQARWVLTQLLSTWMQTALNCAAQNCQSCLPVFGLWGSYPSASLLSSAGNDDRSTTSANSYHSNKSHNLVSQGKKKGYKVDLAPYPAWLDAARALEGPLAQSNVAATAEYDHYHGGSPTHKKKSSPTKLSFPSSPKKSKRRAAAAAARQAKTQASLQNARYTPSIISGRVLPTSRAYANFTCAVVQHPDLFLEGPQDCLSTWGNLLLKHCGSEGNASGGAPVVELNGAKHVYEWSKINTAKRDLSLWRGVDPKDYWGQQQQQKVPPLEPQAPLAALTGWGNMDLPPTPAATSRDEIEDYRSSCRSKALELLEMAMGTSNAWGPKGDPIRVIRATAVWKSQRVSSDNSSGSSCIQALGSFPSPAGYDSSLSFLDIKNPSQFKLQTFLDHGALEATLATNQRCILACMVRTSTLAPLTLLRHLLWDEDIIEDWDHAAGNQAALDVAQQAKVAEATFTLVDVMDWKTCAEEMITSEEANAIVREVMDGTSFYAFASPPEDMFVDQASFTNRHPLLAPLFQAAPVGRLLSDLFARMAKLRTPCSMAMVWSMFCSELRQRWDMREPLPQMNFVPGLDPSPTELANRRKVSTIGVKAELAASLNCSEPDPDDQHCLIGQKLQVFNIGIEVMTSMEAQAHRLSFAEDCEQEEMIWNGDTEPTTSRDESASTKDGSSSSIPARATSSVSVASEAFSGLPQHKGAPLESTRGGKITNLSSLASLQLPKELFKNRKAPYTDKNCDGEGSTGSDSVSVEFFDAEECGTSVFSSGQPLFTRNVTTTVVHRIDRKGARCPLHGRSLVASGDQMYSPYLQRQEPLTDDIILERRVMLSEDYFASEMENSVRVPVQKRLEIAYRLQKPRLLSDMNAFKAANPGAIFQDFVSWYGNPGNPLEDYSSSTAADASLFSAHNGLATGESVAIKLDRATEAIHILNETRNFWSSTWDEATALPAVDQKPLFEVFSTVEMALDYLENMHPAILMNQVMAVNLSNSYFLLANSAKDATKVDVVKTLLIRLRKQTEEALKWLSDEAANATSAFYNTQAEDDGRSSNFLSIEAIAACEAVCASLSEAEVITALATSLLQKFPGQYKVVQSILKQADGEIIELKDLMAQTRVLDVVSKQQNTSEESTPKPVLREYLLRNLDDANPCQLSVRCADASISSSQKNGKNVSSLMLALTECVEDR